MFFAEQSTICQQRAYLGSSRLEGAKRDNEFVYHEPEPARAALPEIIGTSFSDLNHFKYSISTVMPLWFRLEVTYRAHWYLI